MECSRSRFLSQDMRFDTCIGIKNQISAKPQQNTSVGYVLHIKCGTNVTVSICSSISNYEPPYTYIFSVFYHSSGFLSVPPTTSTPSMPLEPGSLSQKMESVLKYDPFHNEILAVLVVLSGEAQ